MDNNLIANASIDINATSAEVWAALVNPASIKQYMVDTVVERIGKGKSDNVER